MEVLNKNRIKYGVFVNRYVVKISVCYYGIIIYIWVYIVGIIYINVGISCFVCYFDMIVFFVYDVFVW